MKRLIFAGLLAGALTPGLGRAADAVYENPVFGVVTTPPMIDATNFINYGQMDFTLTTTLYPFETSSTLNYTNYGTMVGINGFRFEHISPVTGARKMASSFVNHNPGTIVAFSSQLLFPLTPNAPSCFQSILDPSFLHISATNIITGAGTLIGGVSLLGDLNGEIRLVGKDMDLSNSGIKIAGAWEFPVGNLFTVPRDQFLPDVSISDLWWGQEPFDEDDFPLNSAGLWNGVSAFAPGIPTPPHPNTLPAVQGFAMNAVDNADSYVNRVNLYTLVVTNVTGDLSNVFATNITYVPLNLASNLFKGAAFVTTPPGFRSEIGFFASPQGPPRNFFAQPVIVISNVVQDAVTESGITAAIRIQDILAADSRARARNYSTNALTLDCLAQTARPRNYTVDRIWSALGSPGNWGRPDAQFFLNTGFRLIFANRNQIWPDSVTNSVIVDGEAAGYGAFADNIIVRPPPFLPGANETNYPGRVRVYAENLNLENTRIRGEGQVYLEAANLVSTRNAVIDAENISFDLSSANGSVNIENLVPDSVNRFRGDIRLWSAVWTNTARIVFTNNYILTNLPVFDPPGSTNIVGTNLMAILDPITNFCEVGFSATMVDARLVESFLPVNVYQAKTHSRDTVINDNLWVIREFLVEGRSLTVNQQLVFPGSYPPDPVTLAVPADPAVRSFNATVAPNLIFLTNNGFISIANEIHFGDDRSTPYAAIINPGTISASSVSINSSYLQNNGSISSAGGLFVAGNTAKMENGSSDSVNVTRFDVANAKFNGYFLNAGGPLILNVTGALSDAEGTSGNEFLLQDGFRMLTKPRSGSLLRTTITSAAAAVPAIAVNHTWAATDYGVSEAGYVDNAAIGTLALTSASPQPRFNFAGSANQNAIYVDVLDLAALTDITNQVFIAPNLTIYYAAVRVAFTPPPTSNGIPQLPEEYLNGVQLKPGQGRLRWVSTYAGSGSSTPVVINGQTHFVNSALANSQLIDSDGDGVPNGSDVQPNNNDPTSNKFAIAKLEGGVTGNGSVAPNFYGQSLIVGQSYSILAKPNDGSKFVEWSGGVSGTSPSLTFTMESNLVINATFTHSNVSGTYRGLFYEPEAVQFTQSGAITVTTTTSGRCSGSLQIGKNKYSFKGQLTAEGAGTFTIPRSGNTTLTLDIQAGFNYVTGTITDENWTATLNAGRAVFNAKANPAPRAGKYTIIFPGNQNPTNALTPIGDGYGAVTLATSGGVKLTGALGDGTKITQSSYLTEASQWPLYLSLYSGKGQILSWLTFSDSGSEDIAGELSWIKVPDLAAKFYPDGFNVELHASGSTFNPQLSPLTGFSEGLVSFTGGNISPFVNMIEIGDDNKVVNLSSNKFSLKLNSSSGIFSGSAVNPATGKTIKYNGALHQKLDFGAGLFSGTNQSGAVKLEPR